MSAKSISIICQSGSNGDFDGDYSDLNGVPV